MTQDKFGEIRSALHRPPGPGNWAHLTELLERCDPDDLDQRFSHYLEGTLARWPDTERRIPERWLARASEDIPVPYMRWARSAELGQNRGYQLVKILGHEELSELTHLNLWGCGLSEEALGQMAREEALPGLRHLVLDLNTPGRAGLTQLVGAPWFSGLEYLSMNHMRLRRGGFAPVLSAPMPHLEVLLLMSNGLELEDARAMARAEWPSLRYLDLRGNGIDEASMTILRGASWFEQLEVFRADRVDHQ